MVISREYSMKITNSFKNYIHLFCFMVVGCCSASAQHLTSSDEVFKAISQHGDRTAIIAKFHEFIGNYSSGDFVGVYKQLSTNFLNGTNFKDETDYTNCKREFYSDDRTKFIAFVPREIDEIATANTWLIRGCLVERIEGKKSKLKATLQIWKETTGYLFSDFSLLTVALDGKTEKCQ